MMRALVTRALVVLFSLVPCLFAEGGVLLPMDKTEPDEKILSIAEMEIRIRIDNGHARVSTKQIFLNKTATIQEGTYLFSLPGRADISNFAVWDDVVRIPGVILERRRAEEIYNEAKRQVIDPGLLQQGERDVDEARRTSVFSARVTPIPAYGTKRLEMEFQDRLAVEQFQSFLSIPLKPTAYRPVTAGRLLISVEVLSPQPLKAVELVSKSYPLQVKEQTPAVYRAEWTGQNVALAEDFAIKLTLDSAQANRLNVLAYREAGADRGFFEASTLFPDSATQGAAGPKNVIALFDNSLSMQWDKLERSFAALDRLLRSLGPQDKFNVILFNSRNTSWERSPAAGMPENIERALAWVKKATLRGGTDLTSALTIALAQPNGSTVVLMTDGNMTRGADIRNKALTDWYASRRKSGVKLYVFAVGDDANIRLLRQIADVVEWVRSTEPVEFKLAAFLSKLGRKPLEPPSLTTQPATNLQHVYPLEIGLFPGGMQWWVGQYVKPGQQAFAVGPLKTTANLPASNTDHPHLPRAWAKARIDALLDKIDREGEDRESIDEIIRLARKYNFVTPYTSFLAAPRSLLRPRVIRPGDPVLRVRADESISSILAMFPFGLVKPLRYLKGEDVWQTRFLAPVDMPDGKHTVRLILRDKQGRVFRESKTFLIASKPPQVKVRLDKTSFRRGETVRLRVSASESARTITARMYGVSPVHLRWNKEAGSSTAQFVIPAHLAGGRYPIQVVAEDFAHNIGSREVTIDVLP